MTTTLKCPSCETAAFTSDAYGMFHEDDETTCTCGTRLIVIMDDGEECDCGKEDGCRLCADSGMVHEAYVEVVENDEDREIA